MKVKRKLLVTRHRGFRALIRLGLTDALLNTELGRPDGEQWRVIRETGIVANPDSLWFEPTMRCNLRCRFCHQRERRKAAKPELDTATICHMLHETARFGVQRVNLIGGEILLRNDLFEIMDAACSAGMKVKLGSNGVAMSEPTIDKLTSYPNIDRITISIDGPPEIHDALRNRQGAYQASTQAIRALAGKHFMTVICAVLLPDNAETVNHLITLAADLGADRITFMPEMCYRRSEVDASRAVLGLQPDEPIFVDIEHEDDQSSVDLDPVVDAVKHIKAARKHAGLLVPINPRAASRFPQAFFAKTLRASRQLVCNHLKCLTVIENGDVIICPFIQRVIGNITVNPIEEIWNHSRAVELRKKILGSNLLPICAKCCALEVV